MAPATTRSPPATAPTCSKAATATTRSPAATATARCAATPATTSSTAARGNEILEGGDGNDTLQGNGGRDILRGGAGVDGVLYADAAGAVVTVTLDGAADDGSPGEGDNADATSRTSAPRSARPDGTPGAVVLTGNDASNALEVTEGAATIVGAGGPTSSPAAPTTT